MPNNSTTSSHAASVSLALLSDRDLLAALHASPATSAGRPSDCWPCSPSWTRASCILARATRPSSRTARSSFACLSRRLSVALPRPERRGDSRFCSRLTDGDVTLTTISLLAVVAPLAADRYLLRVTIGATTHAKLERARDLLRHTVPNGDPATVLDRALTVLVDQLERRKSGRVSRPSGGRSIAKSPGRHVPSAVKREVWARDQGRCAFVCPRGRCSETGFLEYHHVRPFAAGGATDAANLELRCRAHNAHEATVFLTNERRAAGRSASPYATPLRQS
jgi:5-methylcytosine-specific restriction endonuclease McrA